MSILGRIADLFQAKTNKLLNVLEDPNDTLDLSYEKMLTGLQETKGHLADVVAQQISLERQIGNTDKEIARRRGRRGDRRQGAARRPGPRRPGPSPPRHGYARNPGGRARRHRAADRQAGGLSTPAWKTASKSSARKRTR